MFKGKVDIMGVQVPYEACESGDSLCFCLPVAPFFYWAGNVKETPDGDSLRGALGIWMNTSYILWEAEFYKGQFKNLFIHSVFGDRALLAPIPQNQFDDKRICLGPDNMPTPKDWANFDRLISLLVNTVCAESGNTDLAKENCFNYLSPLMVAENRVSDIDCNRALWIVKENTYWAKWILEKKYLLAAMAERVGTIGSAMRLSDTSILDAVERFEHSSEIFQRLAEGARLGSLPDPFSEVPDISAVFWHIVKDVQPDACSLAKSLQSFVADDLRWMFGAALGELLSESPPWQRKLRSGGWTDISVEAEYDLLVPAIQIANQIISSMDAKDLEEVLKSNKKSSLLPFFLKALSAYVGREGAGEHNFTSINQHINQTGVPEYEPLFEAADGNPEYVEDFYRLFCRSFAEPLRPILINHVFGGISPDYGDYTLKRFGRAYSISTMLIAACIPCKHPFSVRINEDWSREWMLSQRLAKARTAMRAFL